MRRILIIFLLSMTFGQVGENNLSPVVTYWKTLTQEEKEIFLFSYLTMVYETHTELKNSEGYGGITEWYYNNRAEICLLYTSPSPRDRSLSRMPSSA